MLRTPVPYALAFVLCLGLTGPNQAQGGNLILNPDFDHDLSGWTILFERPASWDPLDVADDPGSGSARIGHPSPGNNGTLLVLRQCILVAPNQPHAFGGWARLVPGHPEGVFARIVVQAYANGDCLGAPIGTAGNEWNADTAGWQPLIGSTTTGSEAQSLSFSLGISKAVGVTEEVFAQFDGLYLFGDPIFAADFELP